ncbi:SDR family oxidoreductase [Brachybacterium sp. AOP43-C2-M15]|uniref:SDR family oxidoreductase n=1 Tax=Brachybacterium sp. AOP43-C2-M15 TaxID=3457661 RepID=UPI004034E1BA
MPRHEGRTYVVTGADDGHGALAARTLADRGARVIRCGRRPDCEVQVDLVGDLGRDLLVAEVEKLAPGGVDGLVLADDVLFPGTDAVHVNYFGTLAALAGLRPLLRRRTSPRVAILSSSSSLAPGEEDVIAACLRGDEEAAHLAAEHAISAGRGDRVHRSTHTALNRWVRQSATTDDWAGTGVVLNVIAPGVVSAEAEGAGRPSPPPDRARERLLASALPQPLGFPGPEQAVADAIAWMVSEENSFMAGQIVFVDGGSDAALRSDGPFREGVRYGPTAMGRMLFWALRTKVPRPGDRPRR